MRLPWTGAGLQPEACRLGWIDFVNRYNETVKRSWVICLLLGLAIVTFGAWRAFHYIAPPRLHSEPRRAWKDQAVRDIAARAHDAHWVQNEINVVRTNAANAGVDVGTWMS